MSLNFYWDKVEDADKLHEDDLEWNITQNLAWACMGTGIGKVTADTALELWARLHFWETLHGPLLSTDGETSLYTIEAIRRRIGFTTNVINGPERNPYVETRSKWLRRIGDRFIDDEIWDVKRRAKQEVPA